MFKAFAHYSDISFYGTEEQREKYLNERSVQRKMGRNNMLDISRKKNLKLTSLGIKETRSDLKNVLEDSIISVSMFY